MLRQRRQADYLKPSFLLAPNRSADDQCQECPEGITRDARSAPLTVIVRGSDSGGGKDAMPVLHAGPSLVSGTWATQRVCWLLTAPTLPWPEGPKAAGGARRGTDRRSGPALASHDCLGIPASDLTHSAGWRLLRRAARALDVYVKKILTATPGSVIQS